MQDITAEIAATLQLQKSSDGGWEPAGSAEITVLLAGGSGPITLDQVSRIVTGADGWFVWRKSGAEVSWVQSGAVLLVSAKGGGKQHGRSAPGFA